MNKKCKILITLVLILVIWGCIKPSHDKEWTPDQAILPYAEIDNNLIHVYNIRNFTYRTTQDYDIHYYNKTFNLNHLEKLYYIVEPFSDWDGAAHTFFSFQFEDEFLAVSIEIRKEKGEQFSAIKGLFKQYELMYVLADEQDVVKLRSNYRKDDVYIYPIKVQKQGVQDIFLDMIKKTNHLKEYPEFYHSITNTCTTNLVRHVNTIAPKHIPFSFSILAPGYSDKFIYDLGLIDTNLSFQEAKEHFKINGKAQQYANDPYFSLRIRSS